MKQSFQSPPDECRPLQFVPPFEEWCSQTDDETHLKLLMMWEAGVRGLVLNVSLDDYLQNDPSWEVLRRGVLKARAIGFRIWIYDEKGYPSGAAGGRVLERYPEGEAQGLIRHENPEGSVKYEVIRLYEGTHATENFFAKRPYINILDQRAVSTFVQVTHEQYARVLDPIADSIEAFFTDEPSLISCYVPKGKQFPPVLPWHQRVPEEFRTRVGYDLLPHLESLFRATGPVDRKIRCDFYRVIADLCAETYFGTIQEWCSKHGVASSGHLLGEETMVWQTLFEGDPFPSYRRFDIPGIDMILSDPERIMNENFFLVPKLASSATRLQGKRRVMCEISDFLGGFEGHPATLTQYKCTGSILYALGVTDLVSMYPSPAAPQKMEADASGTSTSRDAGKDLREYADYTARLHVMVARGIVDTRVAVLHPLSTIWAHFTPSPVSMYDPHPNSIIQTVDHAFAQLCRSLLQSQIDFDILDETSLESARVVGRSLQIGNHQFELLLLPPMDTARRQTVDAIARFAKTGGAVLTHSMFPRFAVEGPEFDDHVRSVMEEVAAGKQIDTVGQEAASMQLIESFVSPNCRLTPPSPAILCTRVSQENRHLYLLVNTGRAAYDGKCTFWDTGTANILDPETGSEKEMPGIVENGSLTTISMNLTPFQSIFVEFRS